MTVLQAILLGLAIGGTGGGLVVWKITKPEPTPITMPEPIIVKPDEDEVGQELVKKEAPMCEAEYISSNGTGDCFEWVCLTRDEQGSAACEPISNANTTKRIRQDCEKEEDADSKKECYSFYKERK